MNRAFLPLLALALLAASGLPARGQGEPPPDVTIVNEISNTIEVTVPEPVVVTIRGVGVWTPGEGEHLLSYSNYHGGDRSVQISAVGIPEQVQLHASAETADAASGTGLQDVFLQPSAMTIVENAKPGEGHAATVTFEAIAYDEAFEGGIVTVTYTMTSW